MLAKALWVPNLDLLREKLRDCARTDMKSWNLNRISSDAPLQSSDCNDHIKANKYDQSGSTVRQAEILVSQE